MSIPATANPYAGLRRWAHMLGFGGHFLTKARRYSITFRHLRDTRVTYRRLQDQDHAGPTRAADHSDEETILIVGTLTFAGLGWHTAGDALLANTAAQLKAELIHHKGPWRTVDQLEYALFEYIDWWNHRRLHGEIGMITPVEAETAYYAQQRRLTGAGTQ